LKSYVADAASGAMLQNNTRRFVAFCTYFVQLIFPFKGYPRDCHNYPLNLVLGVEFIGQPSRGAAQEEARTRTAMSISMAKTGFFIHFYY
jgi:hypothetical protein